MGAESHGNVMAGPFRVSVATYAPELHLPSHYHERACVSAIIAGRFEQRFGGRICECGPGIVLAKPPAERHADRWFAAPARHLVVEVEPGHFDEMGASRRVVEEIHHVDRVGAETIAASVERELSEADDLAPVAIEGLVLLLFARVLRGVSEQTSPLSAPSWLATAVDFLHANFATSIRLADVAAAVSVSPDHLSRVFVSAHGTTIGAYVRRLRVDAAATWLATTDDSIAAIAYRVGFADQSHLTRVFKRLRGITPNLFRQALRGS